MITCNLFLIGGRLAIEVDFDSEKLTIKAWTGLPETFEINQLDENSFIGKVELMKEQHEKIKAQYKNGGKCAWCGEVRSELRHCHIFDSDPKGGKMCRVCWEHDREVYKGSYGEDIGPFDGKEEES